MRTFLILTVLVLSFCKCQRQDAQYADIFTSRVLARRSTTVPQPETTLTGPDIKQSLSTASQVFSTLGDIKKVDEFAQAFFKIKPDKLVAALKGISIGGAIIAAFIDIPNQETEKILNNMNTKFDAMFKRMDGLAAELKAYIDQKILKTFILAPIKTAEEGMELHRKKKNNDAKAIFLEKVKNANLPEVMNRVLLNAEDFLNNTVANSRNDRFAFQAMSGVLLQALTKAIAIETYRNGVELNQKKLIQRMKTYNSYINNTVNVYKKIHAAALENLKKKFFPGYIADDIIKPVLDDNSLDGCSQAEKIAHMLFVAYKWRDYVIIVNDRPWDNDFSSYFGVPNRTIFLDSYNGKSILVFMSTEDYNNKKKAYVETEKDKMSTILKNTGTYNYARLVDYARNGNNGYQLAAFSTKQPFCIRMSTINAFDRFDLEIPTRMPPGFTLQIPVSFVLAF